MDRCCSRALTVVAALLLAFAGAALADQGAPVYQAIATKPTQGGACSGSRVQIEFDTGVMWCCGAGGANLWGKCGAAPSGASGTIQTSNGSGLFSSYAGSSCTNQAATSLSAAGALTCATLSIGSQVSSSLAGPLTFSTASGSNAISFSTNGARLDLGAGASDYLYSDGSVHSAGQFITDGSLTVATGNGITADSLTAWSGTATLSLYGNTTAAGAGPAVKIGNSALMTTAGAHIVEFGGGAGAWTAKSFIDRDGNFSGNAATATALGLNGSNCTGGLFALGVDASGNAECSTIAASNVVNDFYFAATSPAAALPTCDSTRRGQAFLRTPASGADEIHVCLANSNATYAWVMFGLGSL